MAQSLERKHLVAPPASIATLALLGGWLCLDFVNTVDPRSGAPASGSTDFLTSYAGLVEWGRHAGFLTAAAADRLQARSLQRARDAQHTLTRALALREALYRVFSAVADKGPPPPADLDAIREAYAEAIHHAMLVPGAGEFVWTWPALEAGSGADMDGLLWPIAASAADLLTSDHLRRVKACAGEGGCGWLFLDSSKNASRRWCSMNGCGSRAKMRRRYARQRDARSSDPPTAPG